MLVRVIVVAAQSELMRGLRNGLARGNGVESALQVSHASDIERHLNDRMGNLIVIDLDTVPTMSRLALLKQRHRLYIVCVANSGTFAAESLRSGGDEFVLKPAIATPLSTQRFNDTIAQKVMDYLQRQKVPAMRELVKMVGKNDKQKILAIASSTGGTTALEVLLRGLPADVAPTVVVQHMSSGFTKLFADRLNATNKQTIREAATGDPLMRGTVLLAPADRHMRLVHRDGRLAVECFVGVKLHGVMPAADILFESVAELVKDKAVGVVLTGMGADGARGLVQMRNAGAKTIGQDEASCVVYGMPKVAKDLGAINFELPLDRIAEKVIALMND